MTLSAGDPSTSERSRVKATKRLPGRWADTTVTGDNLVPEVPVTLPWMPPDDFERAVHEVAEGLGFSFEHDLERRPDIVLGERDIGLDRSKTLQRQILGAALGVGGLLALAGAILVLPFASNPFGPPFLVLLAGSFAAAAGLHVGMEARWESDLLRVRLEPTTTRVLGRLPPAPGKCPSLSVKVFLGRVTSSTSSSQAGSFRSLQKVVPAPASSGEASAIASRLVEVARSWSANALQSSPRSTSPPAGRRIRRESPNLVPLASKQARPEWQDYPRWIVWLRVVVMVAPMVLLMFGPLLMLLPWNYQRIDFTPGSLGTQGLPAEPWTPTGATSGELWWYTYNPAIGAEVNDVPVVVALCPMGTTAIDPGMCHPPAGSTFASLTHADYSVSIPEGWHVVAEVNVSSICSGCHTSVRFSTPATALGLALTLAGIGVLVPCIVIWLRVRARTKSAWPE